MKLAICIYIVTCISPRAVIAESTTIPLPELIGTYSTLGIPERICTIQVAEIPDTIKEVSIRICGALDLGCFSCDGAPADFSIGLEFESSMKDTNTSDEWLVSGEYYTGQHNCDYGEIEVSERIYSFTIAEESNWNFMTVGFGTITVSFSDQPLPIPPHCWYYERATIEITCCELVIEGASKVSTELNSWGMIKTLFK